MKGQELTDPRQVELVEREDRAAGGRMLARALRAACASIAVLAALYLAGFVVFGVHVGHMKPPARLQAADAIVVLTGGQSRLSAAVELLKSGKGKRLLISGVNPIAGADDLSRATGADRSLFACCVDIGHEARDTIGNAEESARWVNANSYGRVIVVTNNYHMPRSLLEMRRLMPGAKLLPYPVVNSPLDNGGWATKPGALRVLFTEYAKYLAALARGLLPAADAVDQMRIVNASSAAER